MPYAATEQMNTMPSRTDPAAPNSASRLHDARRRLIRATDEKAAALADLRQARAALSDVFERLWPDPASAPESVAVVCGVPGNFDELEAHFRSARARFLEARLEKHEALLDFWAARAALTRIEGRVNRREEERTS